MGHYSDERGSNSNRGSQSALLAVPSQRTKWPKGKDFLFSAWAFVIGKNRHNKSSFVIVLLFVYTLMPEAAPHASSPSPSCAISFENLFTFVPLDSTVDGPFPGLIINLFFLERNYPAGSFFSQYIFLKLKKI